MTSHRPVPWLAAKLVEWAVSPELADDITGELEERWRHDGRSRLLVTLSVYQLACAVCWHAWRDRHRPLNSLPRQRGRQMLPTPHDFRLAVRRWTARPSLALTAVLILSLGIGATTSIYSIVDAVLLRPLPWPDPDRLVASYVVRPDWKAQPVLARSWDRGNISWPTMVDLQRTPAFVSFAGWRRDRLTLNGEGNELVPNLQASSNLLPMLGVRVQMGRGFTPEEDQATSDSLVVSHETWQRRFGGRGDIVGQTVSLNETRFVIVGVLPPAFRFGGGDDPEFLLPIGRIPVTQRTVGNHFLNGIGRLAPGLTLAQATQTIDPLVSGDEGLDKKRARLAVLDEDLRGESRAPLMLLLAGAGLLLLIATSNVAALLLGDAGGRRHEIAVRAALGGARRQVARQLFAESLVLGAMSAAGGLALAMWLTPVLVGLAPTELPLANTVTIDTRVFGFALALTFLSSLLFGIGPSLSMSAADPADALRDGGRAAAVRQSRGYMCVVAGQVALAVVLLVGAGLLAETVRRLTQQSLGLDPARVAVTALRLPPIAGSTPEQRMARTQAIVDRLSALPGVEAASATSTAPFSGSAGSNSFQIPGRQFDQAPTANRHIVTERYFETLGMRVSKGRTFDATDQPGAHAAVVTDAFERVWFDGDALGKRFVLNDDEHTIVGVVPAAKHLSYTDDPLVSFYALSRQLPTWSTPSLMVRTTGDPAASLTAIRRAVLEQEPHASLITLETMPAMLRRTVAEQEYRAQLAVAFGVIAVLLSAIGLYGIVAKGISDRRRDIGVRLALGADPHNVRRLVFRNALTLVGVGLVAGVPASLIAAQGIAVYLFGVAPTSPIVVLTAVTTIAGAAVLAALGPALRASRINPIEALRSR